MPDFPGKTEKVCCFAFAPGSRLLALASPHKIRLWDLAAGREISSLPDDLKKPQQLRLLLNRALRS